MRSKETRLRTANVSLGVATERSYLVARGDGGLDLLREHALLLARGGRGERVRDRLLLQLLRARARVQVVPRARRARGDGARAHVGAALPRARARARALQALGLHVTLTCGYYVRHYKPRH